MVLKLPSALDGGLAKVDPVVRVLDRPALLAVAVAELRKRVLQSPEPGGKSEYISYFEVPKRNMIIVAMIVTVICGDSDTFLTGLNCSRT